jgi:hypothetical protein
MESVDESVEKPATSVNRTKEFQRAIWLLVACRIGKKENGRSLFIFHPENEAISIPHPE